MYTKLGSGLVAVCVFAVVVSGTTVNAADMRPMSEWTPENPATLEEINAELEKHRGNKFILMSTGGAFSAAVRKAWLEPLEDEFGINIVDDSPLPSAAQIRAVAETGNYIYDAVDIGTGFAARLLETDSLDPWDTSVVDLRDWVEATTSIGPYVAGGGITWALTMAYNTEVYPGDSGPKSWADFFDLEAFPGPRSLRGKIGDGAQLQIMRLGRNPELLSTEEGRKSLQQISDDVIDDDYSWFADWVDQADNDIVFWEQGSQPPEMLLAGDVNMSSAWNGRIWDAAQQGAPLKICWECGYFVGTGGWVMPKGLAEAEPERYLLANLIAAWASFPENNARFQRFISFGPANTKAPEHFVGPEYDAVREELPTSTRNIPYAVFFDEKWMGTKEDYAEEKLLEAML